MFHEIPSLTLLTLSHPKVMHKIGSIQTMWIVGMGTIQILLKFLQRSMGCYSSSVSQPNNPQSGTDNSVGIARVIQISESQPDSPGITIGISIRDSRFPV
jgi:hypothetical protein